MTIIGAIVLRRTRRTVSSMSYLNTLIAVVNTFLPSNRQCFRKSVCSSRPGRLQYSHRLAQQIHLARLGRIDTSAASLLTRSKNRA